MTMFNVTPKVKPLNQAKTTTCWLACFEMMFEWKNDATRDKSKICSIIDKDTDYWADDLIKNGIAVSETKQIAKAFGMIATGAGDYTAAILHDLVSKKGPLWVGGMWLENMAHVIVVTGVDPDSDKISIINPWKNYDLSESPRTISWLNARGSLWKSREGSVMYWK